MNNILLSTLAASLLVAGTAAQEMNAYPMSGERQVAGLFFWDGSSSPGNFAITYAQPVWKAEYDKMVDEGKAGAMRLGAGYWSTLDSCIDLTIGGVKVPAGMYYLGIMRDDEGTFHLMCLDAAMTRAQKKNPAETPMLKAKINAPLVHKKIGSTQEKLTIAVTPGKQTNEGTLTLHWGNHELSAKVVAEMHGNTVPASLKKEAEQAAGKGLERIKR